MNLHLERLGLKSLTPYGPSHSFILESVLVVCYVGCSLVVLVCSLFFFSLLN